MFVSGEGGPCKEGGGGGGGFTTKYKMEVDIIKFDMCYTK